MFEIFLFIIIMLLIVTSCNCNNGRAIITDIRFKRMLENDIYFQGRRTVRNEVI